MEHASDSVYRASDTFFGRPFLKRFALCYRTVVCPVCPVCDVGVLWPNDSMDEDVTWYGGIGLGPGHTVLDGDPAPPKGKQPPQFSTYVCCRQTAGRIKMPLGTEVGLGPGHSVLDGDP